MNHFKTIDTALTLPDFSQMCQLYREWNERINVISRKDIDNVFEHHILHSLAIAFYLEKMRPEEFVRWRDGGLNVIDVGCGGGFPGIPLASVFPSVHFILCDSIGKKVRVASEVASALGLGNVECVQSRVEDLVPAGGKWDYVVSRAVTSLDNFIPWVAGRYSGSILYLKGGDVASELEQCRRKFGRKMPDAQVWDIGSVLKDEYFAEKVVVNLGICQK